MAHETEILEALFARRSRPRDDDGATLAAPAGDLLVVSCDALEEGVHFRRDWLSVEDLAWKLLAVNLSDAAAMGAEPLGFVLAVAWPADWPAAEASRFGAALEERERAWNCPLLGGDTDVRSGPARFEATVLGRCARPLHRSGAQAGDGLFVTGPLGGAAAIVARRLAGLPIDGSSAGWSDALERFARPRPRLDAARAAVAAGATAAIDLSDGLRPDAARLALASGLEARLDLARVPRHATVELSQVEALALDGGEDYELLVAGGDALASLPGFIRVGDLVRGVPGRASVR